MIDQTNELAMHARAYQLPEKQRDHVRQGGGELLGAHRGLVTVVRLRCGSGWQAAQPI